MNHSTSNHPAVHKLHSREIESRDIPNILSYWYDADESYLIGMGVEPAKMPKAEDFEEMLRSQIHLGYADKKAFATIWILDDEAIGHCNVNKIVFGSEAYMHLHMWRSDNCGRQFGRQLVEKSIAIFQEKLRLKKIYCEPYALNQAPNKTLKHLGFELISTRITVPGEICFEQPTNLWRRDLEKIIN